jgi:hypothetical protein
MAGNAILPFVNFGSCADREEQEELKALVADELQVEKNRGCIPFPGMGVELCPKIHFPLYCQFLFSKIFHTRCFHYKTFYSRYRFQSMIS